VNDEQVASTTSFKEEYILEARWRGTTKRLRIIGILEGYVLNQI
jgi:hypothetical protein